MDNLVQWAVCGYDYADSDFKLKWANNHWLWEAWWESL